MPSATDRGLPENALAGSRRGSFKRQRWLWLQHEPRGCGNQLIFRMAGVLENILEFCWAAVFIPVIAHECAMPNIYFPDSDTVRFSF